MVVKKSRRAGFLEALNKLLLEYDFDGVDYNWEYPQNEQEWKGLVELMRESRGPVREVMYG